MSHPMETCPNEIWHEIFAFACTDTGVTGRSLSLVSKRFHDISAPLKYQSIAITRWRQLIVFPQILSQLPYLQNKIKYLFINFSYPFLDVEDDPRLATKQQPSLKKIPDPSTDVEDSDLDYSISELDSDFDSEFDGSLDSDEELEVLEDIEYMQEGLLPPKGNTRDDHSDTEVLDYKTQAVFEKATPALHAILNETSSTLNILTLYWISYRPLQLQALLSRLVLPFLDELHLYRYSVVGELIHVDLSTTALLPRLRLLVVSGDVYNEPLDRDITIIAPNLTHLRFTLPRFNIISRKYVGEDVIAKMSSKQARNQIQALVRGRGFDRSKFSFPVMQDIGGLPEDWQILWSSRVAGLPDFWNVR